MNELPPNWAMISIHDLGRWTGGGTPSKSNSQYWVESGIPWVSPKDMKSHYISDTQDHISNEAIEESTTTLVPEGSILVVTRSGILAHTLPVAKTLRAVAINQDLKALIPNAELEPDYILYAFKNYQNSILSECGKAGTTVANLDTDRFLAFKIPMSPLSEQNRIVVKLDVLLARTRQAREELENIPTLIEHYKQAILEAAFRGELTVDWRRENNIADDNWTMTSVGVVITDIRYGTAKKCGYKPNGTPVLRIPNVTKNGIDTTDLKYTELTEAEIEKLALKEGDVLVVRSNGSVDLVGRVALIGEAIEGFAYAGYLIRLRPDREKVVPEFLRWMITAPQTRRTIEVNARSTSGVHNINSEEIQTLVVPCTSKEEQVEVVRRIEKAFAWLDVVLDEATSAMQLFNHLEQATLAKAFRGELVPQDPNDEPASILLERIRAARAGQSNGSRRQRS